MARVSTNEDYNALSRSLLLKLEIYFNGLASAPLTVTRSNYLMSCSGLDELGAEDTNPLGSVSANEIDITLFNQNGMFNPANTAGLYYGKIELGVPIKVFVKPDDVNVEWDPLGVFYVSNWSAPSAGTTADVTAVDVLQQVFRLPQPNLPVVRDQAFVDFFSSIFTSLGFSADVSDALEELLNFTYASDKPQALLQEATRAAMSYCTTDKNGNIIVKPFVGTGAVVATLTDSDQINTISITQSAIKTYDGVELTYQLHQLSEQKSIIDLKDIDVQAGEHVMDAVKFSSSPVAIITGVKTTSVENAILTTDINATTNDVVITTTNNGAAMTCDLNVQGITVDTTPVVIATEGTNLLKASSLFIQNSAYANRYQALLKKFVDNPMPTLELSIRGNPKLNIGDKVLVQSEKYKLTYTGIIQRHTYEYTGGLKSNLTLLNALILEG